jgi:apolipoprotein N-acyltransferase
MKSLGLAFLAGFVSALGFAPLGLWPLMLAGFAVLLWLVEGAPHLRSALARGWWFGFGQFVLGLNWIATAFTYQAAMPAWLGWVAVVLLSLYLAIYPAVAAGLAWRWGRADRLALVLILAAAWIVTEWLRATLFTGFAWNPVGVALEPSGLAGLARWIGTYGLSGVAILFGGAFFLALREARRAAAILIFVILGTGALAWAAAPRVTGEGPAIRVVQPNIGQADKWSPEFAERNMATLGQLSRLPGAAPILFWPEAAVTDFLQDGRRRIPRAQANVRATRREVQAMRGGAGLLLTGGVTVQSTDGLHAASATNSIFAIGPDGRILARYDKAHLVPYGEYLPMRPLLSAIGLSRLAPGDIDFDSGPGPRTVDLPQLGRAGFQICYEIIFSGQVVDRANRPDFIFNPSNDAWFGAWGPPQHLAQARLRAIEEGLPVIRATPTGISAVIDANGRLLDSLAQGRAGAIDANLPRPAPPTLFARLGNILPFIFALLLVAAAIAVRRKAR